MPLANGSPSNLLDRLRLQQRITAEFGSFALQHEATLDTLFQIAAERAAEGTQISRAKTLVYDPERGDFLITAGIGWGPDIVGELHVSAGLRSPSGYAFQIGHPMVIEDLPNNPDFDAAEPLASRGIVSLANVPIQTSEAVFGVLEVDCDEHRELDADSVNFLQGLANVLAAAIERWHSEKATRDATAAASAAAAASALQREVLLAELEHRVANDLAAVYGLVTLERRKSRSTDTDVVLDRLAQRVQGIIDHYRQLAGQSQSSELDVGVFLQQICRNLGERHEHVRCESTVTHVAMPLDSAVIVGRLVNEIIVNALKHAFPGHAQGLIRIEFNADDARNEAALVVTDSGRGMGPARPGGQGLQLIGALAAQIGGNVAHDTPPEGSGTRYTVMFPLRQAA